DEVLISRGPRATGGIVKGILPEYERQVSDLLNTVKIGSADALNENAPAPPPESQPDPETGMAAVQQRVAAIPPLILGNGIAERLGATLGSVVMVTSPQGELTPYGLVPKYVRFRVAGIFNSGFYDNDISWAFVRLSDAQRLVGLSDLISVIEFKLDDIYRAG